MSLIFIREKSTPYGGAENYMSRLIKSLERSGHKLGVVNSPISSIFPSWFRVVFFNIYLCLRKKNNFYFSLERIVCPDIYRAGDGVHRVFLKRMSKSSINPLHALYKFLERKCFINAKKIIANSEMVKKEIVENYSIPSEKIAVIYNGIEILNQCIELEPDKSYFKDLNLDSRKITFLFVGNGFERKGLYDFIDIIDSLREMNVQAIIIGRDKNSSDFSRYIENKNLGNIIRLIGNREDVNLFYKLSDFVVLPTKYDPFSNVILEAMNFSNVVITTKQNGSSEILDKEWIMKSHDDLSVKRNILFAIKNKSYLNETKIKNFEISLKFSIEKNASKTVELIKEVYDNKY